jgi:hypothetical protein
MLTRWFGSDCEVYYKTPTKSKINLFSPAEKITPMVLKNNHLISGVKEQALNHYKYMYVR